MTIEQWVRWVTSPSLVTWPDPEYLRPGRAAELARIRHRALAEAAREPRALPSSLRERDMRWYRLAVPPVLRALTGVSTQAVVTAQGEDGVPVEVQGVLQGPDLRPLVQPSPPPPVLELHEMLHRHEAAVLAAAEDPTQESLRVALALDPTVPEHLVDVAADSVLASFSRWRAAE